MIRLHQIASLLIILTSFVAAQEPKPPTAAELYESGMNDLIGSALSRDGTRGLERIRESAHRGYAPAQMAAAFYAESAPDAFDWCKKAATQGDALGAWCVGIRYLDGNGAQRSVTEAEKWLRKAADAGNPFAAYTIGVIKLDRDPKAAAPWFQQAAEQGLPQAQRQLARLLMEGVHAPKDKYRAYVWFLVSDETSLIAAEQESTLENDLGSAAVSKAKTEARDLATKVSRTANAHGCTGWDGEFDASPTLPPPSLQKFCR
jgi:TPR repeat protein